MTNQAELGEQSIREGLDAISRLGQDLIKENRRTRRWRMFRRLFFWLIIIAIFFLPTFDTQNISGVVNPDQPHIATISLQGLVMPEADIDADQVIESLQNAFAADQSKGIMLKINSPGGSPVQAERIYDEIIRLRALYPEKKVVAVIEDIGASAAYYIASAANEITASKASIVGSIGVIVNGFGAVEAMKKLGLERRLITAGENKGMLDPFSPQDKTQEAYMQGIVDQVHTQFITAVKAGRGERLSDRADIFSGLVWNGEEAVQLGLVDHIGSSGYVMREVFDMEKQVDYSPVVDWLETFSRGVGASLSAGFNQQVLKQGPILQ